MGSRIVALLLTLFFAAVVGIQLRTIGFAGVALLFTTSALVAWGYAYLVESAPSDQGGTP